MFILVEVVILFQDPETRRFLYEKHLTVKVHWLCGPSGHDIYHA